MTIDQGTDAGPGRWDPLVGRLQALRQEAGEPSYAELARRISAARMADGIDEHAARIARSSVHDAFRLGRTRINVPLVREVVRALDADPGLVDRWLTAPAQPGAPADPAATEPGQARGPARSGGWRQLALLLLACVVANRAGAQVTTFLHLPVYLDMVGTAVAAIAVGPWRGAAVGVATNLAGVPLTGAVALPFALVNVVGALLWGYGVRRLGLGRSLPRFFALNLVVALCCTLVAAPILVLLYGGSIGQGQDALTDTFWRMTHQLAVSVGLGNLLTSLGDKVISGFVALVTVSALPAGLRAASCLAPALGPGPAASD